METQELAPRRKHQIEILQRFLQSHTPLLSLVGEEGVGKKYLANELIAQIQTQMRVIFIEGNGEFDPSLLAAILAQHWVIPTEETSDYDLMNEVLAQLEERDQKALLIINKAHDLPIETLTFLSQLSVLQNEANRVLIHILLLGELSLLEKINTLEIGSVPHLVVEPLSRKEIWHLMTHWLLEWDISLEETLSETLIDELFHQSKGFPGIVKQLAKQWADQHRLSEKNTIATVSSADNAYEKVNTLHESTKSITQETPTTLDTVIIPEQPNAPDPIFAGTTAIYTDETESFWNRHKIKIFAVLGLVFIGAMLFYHKQQTRSAQLNELSAPITNTKEKSSETISSQNVTDNDTNAIFNSSPPDSPRIAALQNTGNNFAPSATENSLASSQEKPAIAASHAENSVTTSAQPTKNPPHILTTQPSIVKQEKKLNAIIPVKSKKITLVRKNENKDEALKKKAKIAEKPLGKFALQLMGSSNKKTAQQFITEQGLKNTARIQITQHDGKNWFVVLYGHYTDRKEALHEMKNLSPHLKKLHPWVKAVG